MSCSVKITKSNSIAFLLLLAGSVAFSGHAFAQTTKTNKPVAEEVVERPKPKTLFDLFKKPATNQEIGQTDGPADGKAEKKPLFGNNKANSKPQDNTKQGAGNAVAFGSAGIESLLKQKGFAYNGRNINPAGFAAFYKENRYKPIWTEKSGFLGIKKDITPEGKKLIAALKDAKNDGFEGSKYFNGVPGALKTVNGSELAQIELYLTAAFIDFARDLHLGTADLTGIDDEILPFKKEFNADAMLRLAARQGVNAALNAARPQHPQYAALRGLLSRTLDPRKRSQIAANMERWRWLPDDLGQNYVLVNQAAFKVYIYSGNNIIDERNVVVGKPEFKSPLFSDTMEYVEFNPQWNVPVSIAVNEFLPKLLQNKSYAFKAGYTVYEGYGENASEIDSRKVNWSKVEANQDTFPYRFVQGEGGDNALGEVKFLFPNKFNVYLHDTPSKKLFKEPARAFSHGCIRVQDPLDFAEKVFSIAGGISPDKIRPLVKSKERKQVNLSTKLPVHLTYFTVWMNNGQPQYLDDFYGRDAVLAALIN